jgi:hypothetical protein
MKIYEAVAEEEGDDEEGRDRRKRERERARLRRRAEQQKGKQAEGAREKEAMDQFGDMLREYLTCTLSFPSFLPRRVSSLLPCSARFDFAVLCVAVLLFRPSTETPPLRLPSLRSHRRRLPLAF